MKMKFLFGMLGAMLALTPTAEASQQARDWELINPEGIVEVKPVTVVPHHESLEGKTVVLRWNGKPNGNLVLDRVAELLKENVKDINVVKAYEVDPMTGLGDRENSIAGGLEGIAKRVLAMKPYMVISSQGD